MSSDILVYLKISFHNIFHILEDLFKLGYLPIFKTKLYLVDEHVTS